MGDQDAAARGEVHEAGGDYHTFYEPNRRRDKSNVAAFGVKVIEDALVMCGVLKDDGWAYIRAFTSRFALDKEKPRIVVRITDEGAE